MDSPRGLVALIHCFRWKLYASAIAFFVTFGLNAVSLQFSAENRCSHASAQPTHGSTRFIAPVKEYVRAAAAEDVSARPDLVRTPTALSTTMRHLVDCVLARSCACCECFSLALL